MPKDYTQWASATSAPTCVFFSLGTVVRKLGDLEYKSRIVASKKI